MNATASGAWHECSSCDPVDLGKSCEVNAEIITVPSGLGTAPPERWTWARRRQLEP